MPPTNSYPLVALLGPTGSGKSALAVEIAEQFGGEIVSCDSVQVYRGFDIGSAKLGFNERRGVAHHLIDSIEPHEELTAGAYSRRARGVLKEIKERHRLPVIVGGTGFYLRALLQGLSPAPGRNPELRTRLREARPGALHRLLRRRDPAAAGRIHPNDEQKLIRAIELAMLADEPAARRPLEGFRVLKLGLNPPRAALYDQINERSRRMFNTGLLEEVQALFHSGIPAQAKPLQTLGYRQAVEVLQGCVKVEDAILECQTKTRQYAKRQMTWYRREPDVEWLNGFGGDSTIRQAALERVRIFLAAA